MSCTRCAPPCRATLVALLAFGVPAWAQAAQAPLDAAALGKAEALSKFCAKADPASAEGLRKELARLTQGARPGALSAARASDEYRKARDAVVDFAGKVDTHNVHRLCTRSAPVAR